MPGGPSPCFRQLVAIILLAPSLLTITGCGARSHRASTLSDARLVDLSHAFGAETIVWPTEQEIRVIVQYAGKTPRGYYYASNRLEMPEHGGTHLDAPIHFAEGGLTMDQVPLERLIGPAVRIDLSALCKRDRDYRITVQDVERWESERGRIPDGSIVLLETGFAEFWPSRTDYLGTELRGEDGVRALHFPGLHPDAADWLVRDRRIRAVGIDTASIDYGQSTGFESHVTLLSRNVPVLENLAHLDRLPDRGFDIVALPLKIAGGSGGPVRIVAILSGSR